MNQTLEGPESSTACDVGMITLSKRFFSRHLIAPKRSTWEIINYDIRQRDEQFSEF